MTKIRFFDSVRDYGLFLILGYHLFYNVLPGGFLGVDIFFTFSGYLITALIIKEASVWGGFNVLAFWRRRFIRLFPPLFFAVVFTLPLCAFISPDFLVGIGRQLAAAFGFVTNLFEISSGGDYEAQLLPHLYIHTWFISVEAQFYLAWGIVCFALTAAARAIIGESQARVTALKTTIFIIASVCAALSYLKMRGMALNGSDSSAIYFNTFAHAFPFLIGSAAAALWGVQQPGDRSPFKTLPTFAKVVTGFLAVLAAAAIAEIAVMCVRMRFDDSEVFTFGLFATSLLTVAVIYGARALHNAAPASVCEPRPVRAVANLSCCVYLFHYPLYIIFSALISSNGLAAWVTVAVSFAMSAVVYYGIEPLFRPRKEPVKRKPSRPRIAWNAAVALITVIGLTASAAVVSGAPSVTTIEDDFAAGYVTQDVNKAVSLYRRISALNASPSKPEPTPEPTPIPTPEPTPVPTPYPTPEPTPQQTPTPAPSTPEPTAAATEKASPTPEPTPIPTPEPTPPPTPEPTPQQTPTPEPAPTPDITGIMGGVTIIGDSVALGAQSALENAIPDCYVDAKVSRSISAGHDVMLELQKKGMLREYVVIALGTNGHINYAKLITQIIDDLEPGHRLILVTPFDGRNNENASAVRKTAAWERDLPSQYDFLTLADWNDLIAGQPNLLAGDKVHMGGGASMKLYAECVVGAISEAADKPMK